MEKTNEEHKWQLIEEGHKQLKENNWAKAAATFAAVLEIEDEPAVRNNLSYAIYLQGRFAESLDVLEPVLDPSVVSPFGRALAALIYADLGEKEKAEIFLKQAIEQFDRFVRSPQRAGFQPNAFREYTILIKKAAGRLDKHRLIMDLHRKWQSYYQSSEDLFQAGVAFFNENYPSRARQAWSRIAEGRWQFLEDYIQVADQVELGLVPNFPLPYQLPDLDLEEGFDAKNVADGRLKMLLLSGLFDPEADDEFQEQIVMVLCEAPEDWSIEFGKALLQSNSAPMPWKFAAGRALTERGVFKKGTPIPILIDGETREVYLETKDVKFATPEQQEMLEEARSLFVAGEYEKALQLVQKDFAGEDVTMESLELLAKIHAKLGEAEQAAEIAELFAKIAPVLESPVPLLTAAGIYLLVDDVKSAKEQFAKIDKDDLPPETLEYYTNLQMVFAIDRLRQRKPPARGSGEKTLEKDPPAAAEITPGVLSDEHQYLWYYEEIDQMSTEEIAAYLLGLGVDFKREEFVQATTVEFSAAGLAESWYDDYNLEITGYDADFPWLAAWVLWNRLAEKGNFCREELDELLMKGYDLVKDGSITAGCDVWLEVWEAMKYKIRETGRPLAFLAEQYMGTFFVTNFVQDLANALRQAAKIEPLYQQKRLDFARELLSLAPVDESWDEESLIHNFKRAVAESYVGLGKLKRAEEEFLKLVQDHPQNFWSYIACGDFYEHGGGNNLEKAREFYLKAARLTKGTADHEITSERLNYLESLAKKEK